MNLRLFVYAISALISSLLFANHAVAQEGAFRSPVKYNCLGPMMLPEAFHSDMGPTIPKTKSLEITTYLPHGDSDYQATLNIHRLNKDHEAFLTPFEHKHYIAFKYGADTKLGPFLKKGFAVFESRARIVTLVISATNQHFAFCLRDGLPLDRHFTRILWNELKHWQANYREQTCELFLKPRKRK